MSIDKKELREMYYVQMADYGIKVKNAPKLRFKGEKVDNTTKRSKRSHRGNKTQN